MKARTITLLALIVSVALSQVLMTSVALPSAAPEFLMFVRAHKDTDPGVDGLAGALSVAISPRGNHVYVAGYSENAVAVFSRDGSTGELTYVEMQRDGVGDVDGLGGVDAIAVSPDGKHVYVAGYYDDAVTVFGRDGISGALTFVEVHRDTDPGVDGLNGASSVALSPDGSHVYVASYSDHAVALFSRDESVGALTYIGLQKDGVGDVDGLNGAHSVAVSPDGRHVYVASRLENAVAVFERDDVSGALIYLEMLQDGVGDVDGLDGAHSVSVSPDGHHVYVASLDEDAVAIFSRDGSTGGLTYVGMEQDGIGGVDGLDGARSLTLSPDGHHVYVAGSLDNAVAVFIRDRSTGALSYLEMLQNGVAGVEGLGGAAWIAASPDRIHVYVAGNGDDAVAVFWRHFGIYLPTVMKNHAEPYLVKDINPTGDSSPDELTGVNGTLFFVADDGAHGVELWKSDGTAAGTALVKDINTAGDSSPHELVAVNGTLFFVADDGAHGLELWKSDGTTAGTTLVKNINPSGESSPDDLTEMNGMLFFSADDGSTGWELWKSNGTAAGTTLVKDINPAGDSYPEGLADVNGTLFFGADDGTREDELWKSDGTPGGTMLVKDINPTGFSNPTRLANVNGTLFFVANDGSHGIELWKSDGTAAGTVQVRDINAADDFYPDRLVNVNGMVFFNADDGIHGEEVWKSDGTTAGTMLVKDIDPTGSANPTRLTDVNGMLFFTADDGVRGAELWKSDGTTSGTVLVKDINPTGRSDPTDLFNANGVLFFGASDGAIGRELWRSDGTEAGTVLVQDINPTAFFSSFPGPFVYLNGTLFFEAEDGVTGEELWALRLNR